jgi:MFS family permease
MKRDSSNPKILVATILSMSLLTVMAGAAVAPALNAISAHFADANPLLIQFVVSMPALFIILTNLCFPMLCRVMRTRTIALCGLLLYVVAGSGAFFADNIVVLLVLRALLGVSVGMIMPLSTGLLAYYFPPEEQARLMGLAAAMNQMGGVVAFLVGLVFGAMMKRFAAQMKYTAPIGFMAGYLCLAGGTSLSLLLLGSALIGIANGIGVPYLNTIGSVKAGKEAPPR